VQREYLPLYQRHLMAIDLIRKLAQCGDGVVYFDLIGQALEGYNKFIPYYLFSGLHLHRVGEHAQFSHQSLGGSNPWAAAPLTHNLASICERYGGGGHPRVGAISFPRETSRARAASRPRSARS